MTENFGTERQDNGTAPGAIIIPDICPDASVKPKKTHDEWIKAHIHPGNPKNGDKPHTFTPCHYITKSAPLPNTPLTGITDDMDLFTDNGDCHHFLIVNGDVFMNGSIIASAPVYGNNGRKKTVAQQHTFCKAVIWSLKNDDNALNEYAAKYPSLLPAAVPTVKEPEVITVQEPVRDILPILAEGLGLTDEEINGFPVVYPDIDLMPEMESMVKADIEEMVGHYESNDGNDADALDYPDEDLPAISEMWAIINPIQVIRQWTYRGMSIIEEMITA